MVEHVSSGAVKVIEIIGISETSFDDAVSQAVAKASQSISGITGVEVLRMSAGVTDGRITQYRADVKLAFIVR